MVTSARRGRWRPAAVPCGVVLGVLVAAGLATLIGGVPAGPARARPAPAVGTVISSQPCARAGARDTVVFVVDGRSHELPLDACGNPEGIRLDVEMIMQEDGTAAVRLAGAGASAPSAVIADRAGALLLALAGVAGALLIVFVRTPLHAPATPRQRPVSTAAPNATPEAVSQADSKAKPEAPAKAVSKTASKATPEAAPKAVSKAASAPKSAPKASPLAGSEQPVVS